MTTIHKAITAAIEALNYVDNRAGIVPPVAYEKISSTLNQCKAALADIENCEPVALVALNNAALQKRIDVLEDLLTSAASIASRNGEGTHWERFIGQLKVNGIGNITAKTFRVLPSDEGYTSPISKEWVGLSDSAWMNIVNHDHAYESMSKEDAVHYAVKVTEAKLKQLNSEKG